MAGVPPGILPGRMFHLRLRLRLRDEGGHLHARILAELLTDERLLLARGRAHEEDLDLALREGKTPSGRELSPPMPRFHEMTDPQLNAIYTYLRSLHPVNHKLNDK